MKSLSHVLGKFEDRYTLQERKHLQKLVLMWQDIVGDIVAAQTRPISIQRGVLRVATASAAWAQNLVFERQRLIEKLNAKLALGLVDIRFSTADWQTSKTPFQSITASEVEQVWQNHPSRLPLEQPVQSVLTPPETAMQSYLRWADRVRSRSRDLPLCPHCHCPTPPQELQRWSVCAPCASQAWHQQALAAAAVIPAPQAPPQA